MTTSPTASGMNLGPKTAALLAQVGIPDLETLGQVGAVEAYCRLKRAFPRQVSLNALYGMEAALMRIHWLHLPDEIKQSLREQAERCLNGAKSPTHG
ncbi:MAG: TfoX/Sxy family protein [Pleurocapsa minor GSE-CHR-MK-17-07R]|nr:TfoX/Sxy family protein [Pleurocapsa minor GSE-CHR-MK 17-07R]